MAQTSAVQRCYRVSPGPDFVLVVHVVTMPGYLALAQRLFTSDANVRSLSRKCFWSIIHVCKQLLISYRFLHHGAF